MKTNPSTPDRERWTPDQDAELTKLRGAGQTYPEISQAMKRSQRSVRARMTVLGNRAKYAASAAKTKASACCDGLAVPEKRARVRKCLCCDKDFFSQGPHNRLCGTCRSKPVGPYDI